MAENAVLVGGHPRKETVSDPSQETRDIIRTNAEHDSKEHGAPRAAKRTTVADIPSATCRRSAT